VIAAVVRLRRIIDVDAVIMTCQVHARIVRNLPWIYAMIIVTVTITRICMKVVFIRFQEGLLVCAAVMSVINVRRYLDVIGVCRVSILIGLPLLIRLRL